MTLNERVARLSALPRLYGPQVKSAAAPLYPKGVLDAVQPKGPNPVAVPTRYPKGVMAEPPAAPAPAPAPRPVGGYESEYPYEGEVVPSGRIHRPPPIPRPR